MPEGDPQETLLTQEAPKGDTLLDNQTQSEGGESTEGGEQTPSWITENLKGDIAANKSLGKFTSVAGLADSYVNLERRIGDSARIPGPNATADELNKFYSKLGRPETPDGYELTSILPEIDGEAGAFKETAHKLGLSKQQAETVWNMSQNTAVKTINKIRGQLAQDKAANENKLRTEYGDEYDNRIAGGARIARKFGGEEYMQLMRTTRLGDNPIQIKFLANIDKAQSEDTLEGGTVAEAETGEWSYPKSPELK